MLELLKNFFDPNWFIPHGHCYLWKPELVSLHIVSDALITLAYYSIPLILLYFLHNKQDLPFSGIFLLFVTFIVSCGTSHLLEIWTLWHPAYWLSGTVKAVTAIASCYTAVELARLTPKALALSSPAQLREANQKLEQEILERKQAEAALRDSEARFRSIFEGAGIGMAVVDMEGHVVAANPAIKRMLGNDENQSRKTYFQEDRYPEEESRDWDRYIDLITGKYDYSEMAKRFLGKDGHLIWGRDCYQMEKRFLSKNGQLLWCNVTVSLVRDANGNPQFGIRMVEDITARKQAEVALKQYHDHLEKLVAERTAELTKVNQQLSWQANHDELTGLPNRHEFEQHLQKAVSTAKLQNQEHTLCYLDLDRFKVVNDTCGHLAGDELLRQVSILLQANVRRTDILARLGGDEFGLLLFKCSLDEAQRVAQALLESVQCFRFVWQEKCFSIGVSMGLVAINASQVHSSSASLQNLDSFMNAADAACYVAKNRGRNRVHIYQASDAELAKQRLEGQWVERINQALADNRFHLYSQRILCLGTNSNESPPLVPLAYHEILLRLLDETDETVSPMLFLPVAERYGLMPMIDRWVIRRFFSHLSEGLRDQSLAPNMQQSLYALNLSGATLNDDYFMEFLQEQFSIHSIPPQLICFEIPETVAIANLNQATQLIKELKALGCRFALDDFGSGMSSFAYLKYLPVDYLKIDGALVKDIVDEPMNGVMVEAINRVAHVMGLQTIAEFVTNDTILEKVRALGVDYAQGYGIALPQPICSFPANGLTHEHGK